MGNPFFLAEAGGGGPSCTEEGNVVLPGTGERYVMSTSSSSKLVSLTASNSRTESRTPPRLSYPLCFKRGSSKSYRLYLFLVRPEVEELRPSGGASAADPLNSSGRYNGGEACSTDDIDEVMVGKIHGGPVENPCICPNISCGLGEEVR